MSMPKIDCDLRIKGASNIARCETCTKLFTSVERQTEGCPVKKLCEAKQHSDQMHCAKCDLTWDMNDWCPPICGGIKNVRESTNTY